MLHIFYAIVSPALYTTAFVLPAFACPGSAAASTPSPASPRPVLQQLVTDSDGLYCYSALASFRARTAYANVANDSWVLWSNGSVRSTSQLPALALQEVSQGRGVLRVTEGLATATTAALAGGVGSRRGDGPAAAAPSALATAFSTAATAADDEANNLALDEMAAAPALATASAPAAAAADDDEDDLALDELALSRLSQLSWRRVDVSFGGVWLGTAHTNIQGAGILNRAGLPVLQHLAESLVGFVLADRRQAEEDAGPQSQTLAVGAGEGQEAPAT